jgi:sialate O-acetylesterase
MKAVFNLRTIFTIIFFGSCITFVNAEVRLPHIFSNNMVLQRNVPIPIWGWAAKGEKIKLVFGEKKFAATANNDGKWLVYMDPMPAGGPYELVISATNQIIFKNILIGEVWICSGQSNMEWPLNNVNNAAKEVMEARNPQIRLFTVPKKISAHPETDIESGNWQECSPETASEFSAVGYFFGKNLYKDLNVPIGLINSSWGGTVLETWTSFEAISTIPDFQDALTALKKIDIKKKEAQADSVLKEWKNKLENDDQGKLQNWKSPEISDSSWNTMDIPQAWEHAGLNMDGVVWFRKEIVLDSAEVTAGITINLGAIDDSDQSFLNGEKIGETINQYSKKRIYTISPGILKKGKNLLAVRVTDTGGGGGIWGDPKDLFYNSVKGNTSLAGLWKYNIGIDPGINPTEGIGPNAFPTLLFNGMISPILPYALQGAIWYQGESNASRAYQYETIFPILINDWRKQWNNSNLSFLFVQLANYMAAKPEPENSSWAELRDAQLKTLSVNKTGMAVIIDIGEANDIHPRNKQDVGYRLSLAARKVAYNEQVLHSGPTFDSFTIDGNKLILKFNNIGSGLIAKDKYGYLKGFTIAGEDQKFVWAKAIIDGDKVIVWSDDISNPVNVRYAWADNPDDANFYNKEGLPASPFRTDNWKGITQ